MLKFSISAFQAHLEAAVTKTFTCEHCLLLEALLLASFQFWHANVKEDRSGVKVCEIGITLRSRGWEPTYFPPTQHMHNILGFHRWLFTKGKIGVFTEVGLSRAHRKLSQWLRTRAISVPVPGPAPGRRKQVPELPCHSSVLWILWFLFRLVCGGGKRAL